MTSTPLAGVISAVCDAVRAFAMADDASGASARVREALAALGRQTSTDREGDSPVEEMLAAIKELARAQELISGDDASRAETALAAAADRLSAAATAIERMQSEGRTSSGGAVQLSVAEAVRIPNEEAVSDALENLLDRSETEAFVIFVDAKSGNFVQFIGSKKGPLVLDLPFTSLSEEERARAHAYFEREGFEDAKGEEGFSIGLERNVGIGTELALGIFRHVYRADPDFSLKIEEN